jgi:DNA-binding response OmpR family regulator
VVYSVPEAMTILLIESDAFLASAWKNTLEKGNFHVLRTDDPVEGLRTLESPRLARSLRVAIVCGDHLPGVSGPEFVAELSFRRPGLPILVLAAEGEPIEGYERASTMAHVLRRPVSGERLLAAVVELVVDHDSCAA